MKISNLCTENKQQKSLNAVSALLKLTTEKKKESGYIITQEHHMRYQCSSVRGHHSI